MADGLSTVMLDRAKGTAVKALKRAGFERPSRLQRDEAAVRSLLAWSLREDTRCVDVGAHKGDFLADMVRLAPAARHVAIEPLPHLADGLRKRFHDVEIHSCALGAAAGRATFVHNVSREALSGLRERDYEQPVNELVRFDVEVKMLDHLLAQGERVGFIKIDVEGGELDVLRGAQQILRRHRPTVVFEFGRGAADRYGVTPADVSEFFENVDMRVFDIDGGGPLIAAEMDDIFESGALWNFVALPRRSTG